MPDAFNDAAKVTKSHMPVRINIPVRQTSNSAANESAARKKRGRPIGSKDLAPRKRRLNMKSCPSNAPEEVTHNAPEEEKWTYTPQKRRNVYILPRRGETEIYSPEAEKLIYTPQKRRND